MSSFQWSTGLYPGNRDVLQGIDLRVTLALRWRLLLLWLFMLVVSGALAYIIREVYQLGSEVQAQKSVEQTAQACAALQTEYGRSVKPGEDIVDRELMNASLVKSSTPIRTFSPHPNPPALVGSYGASTLSDKENAWSADVMELMTI